MMNEAYDLGMLTGGVGLFLLGMYLLEDNLKQLAGRSFKLFLRKFTHHPLGAIAGGAVVTAVLQSSSVVSLMVLAFVGAGIFDMRHALAVILGCNLGTTVSSWIVATVGFSMNVVAFVYPLLGLCALVLLVFNKQQQVRLTCLFLIGIAVLFIGLELMKSAMAGVAQNYRLPDTAHTPLIMFLVLGFVITFIIQSSSATIAITLSALYNHALSFEGALAVVIGAEIGTTIKILIGAIGGMAVKKRVAVGNFMFNVMISVPAFLLIRQFIFLLQQVAHVQNPLIGLVLFQSMINLLGIIVFVPFLPAFSRWLDKLFPSSTNSVAPLLAAVSVQDDEPATEALRSELKNFALLVMRHNRKTIGHLTGVAERGGFRAHELQQADALPLAELYDHLKLYYAEIHSFYMRLKDKLKEKSNVYEVEQLISAARNLMYAAKGMKDVRHNLDELARSANDFQYEEYQKQSAHCAAVYARLKALLDQPGTNDLLATLQQINGSVYDRYHEELARYYTAAAAATLSPLEMASLINLNREIQSSNKAMVKAVGNLLLNRAQLEILEEEMEP